MNSGFYINRLVSKGTDCEDALIKFSSNAHVIIGPSNTGKTYIFQCLKYMLGSTKKPKKIKESYGYESCYLEIVLSDKSKHTLHRNLSGGDALLYECPYEEIDDYSADAETLIVGRKPTKKNNTLHNYLLTLSNLTGKKVRRNKGGVTDDFSFPFLRHLTLIDEISIIKEESPIYSGQNSEGPKEESIFRFLLTGKDDSNIGAKPKQKVIDNRKGRLEVLKELISDYQKELANFDDISVNKSTLNDQIEKLGVSIVSAKDELKSLYAKINVYESTVDLHWITWKENESRLITINELLSRFSLLRQHYESDISRLEAVQETSSAFFDLNVGLCPICNSELIEEKHDGCSSDDIDDILKASSAEISKIESLQKELYETKRTLNNEKEELLLTIEKNKENHIEAQRVASEFSSEYIKKTVNFLDELRLTLSERKQALKVIEKLDDLEGQKERYEEEIDPMDGDYSFDELTTSITTEFCGVVKDLLDDWGYEDVSTVSFSEETCDLVINSYDRNLSGKGYRALAYSAFIIGLMHICLKSNNNHSGIVLLDSPLCTLRSRHIVKSDSVEHNDVLSDVTKETFYSSIAKHKGMGQIIILDNDGPANPSTLEIGYTEFTQDENEGRYGFYPNKRGL